MLQKKQLFKSYLNNIKTIHAQQNAKTVLILLSSLRLRFDF